MNAAEVMDEPQQVPPAVAPQRRLSFAFAKRHGVLIKNVSDGEAECIYREHASPLALAEVRRFVGRPVRLERVPEAEFDLLLREVYEAGSDTMQAVEGLDDTTDLAHLAQELPEQADLLDSDDDAPIIRLINAVLTQAVKENASDIHVEPFENRLVVRFRVDGVLREVLQSKRAVAPLYPGSDLDRFAPPPGAEVADDCLGMVYRLARDKLDEGAMEPFIEAIRIRPGTRALIVGGGVSLERYRRRVAEAGMADAFEFTGYVEYEALPALYRRMSVFVAPVHRESFGQVTSFAMGMRLPVVGYAVGAIPEIVADDALLAPAGDGVRLGAIAAALLDDRARRVAIGAANRARAERLFSVRAMIAAYETLYEELTSVSARAGAETA